MSKHLILIHGRNFKPCEGDLREVWLGALGHALERDFGPDSQELAAYRGLQPTFVYYGDISNEFLGRTTKEAYDIEADTADRAACLEKLKTYSYEDFLGERGKSLYNDLPAKNAFFEGLADTFSGLISLTSFGDELIGLVAPDMREYFNQDSSFGSEVRWRLTEKLAPSMEAGDDIMLLGHSLGTMICYDTLWKFSHYGEYQYLRGRKVNRWLTMGSPLADENIKDTLKGAASHGLRRYPHNIEHWYNIAAEDDFVAHDETVANDFHRMLNDDPAHTITDRRIYNLAVRHGESNPHHGAGYLIHPTTVGIVADWLVN